MITKNHHKANAPGYIFAAAVLVLIILAFTSCTSTRQVTATHTNTDSTTIHITDSMTRVLQGRESYYKSVIQDLQSYDMTFENNCPNTDSVLAILDSIGKLNYARLTAKPAKLVVSADGSITAEGLKRAIISKSLATEQFRVFREWSDSMLRLRDVQVVSLQKQVDSKVKVVERSYIPIWVWILMAALAIGTYGLGWWRTHGRA